MRLISALLCFCLTFNVLAASGTVGEFEKALDNFQYDMTVEMDQSDLAAVEARTEAFYSVVSELMNQGLSTDDIVAVVTKKSKNPKELEALTIKMKAIALKANSPSELAAALAANSNNMYASGASWEGSMILISAGIVAIFAAAIAYSIWHKNNKVCVATVPGQDCGWITQFPGGPQYFMCWETVTCARYEDK